MQQPIYDPNFQQHQQPVQYGQPYQGQPVYQQQYPPTIDPHHPPHHHHDDHHHHKSEHKVKTKHQRRRNLAMCIVNVAIIIAFTILSKNWSTMFYGLFTYINIAFIFMKKDSKVSFLRCRVCLVFVWFGIIVFIDILALIFLFVGGAIVSAVGGSEGTKLAGVFVGIQAAVIIIQIIHGITYVKYVQICTEKYWDRIHHGYTRHH
ncbi:UNKNOWN [Stylonychia lemnae]|uniref:Uncharacterized protein n=1 Tax=Stylonychia lemnae TaxID=5949 RepID=A0A078AZD5_STYLE|nr:UNKNOWN [Stylonychia lemnae]|eukprot:CDW87471.1 UNKNOWN [Stylonychia lemnae]